MRWHITAVQAGADAPELVAQVRELRARILFDHGRRPGFRSADGAHVDDQVLDYGAWHFIARREPGGPPLGYIRLSTPDNGHLFQSRAYLGSDKYEELIAERGFLLSETFEHSRLVVEHRARKLGLGVHLNAIAISAAHSLGAKAMIGTSGTKDGQDKFHERFGFVGIPETRRYVEHYAEDVIIMFYRAEDGAGQYTDLVRRLRDEFPALAESGAHTASATFAKPVKPAGLDQAAQSEKDCWRPVLFRSGDGEALSDLLASGVVREVHDTIDTQLEELIRSREPAVRFDEDLLTAKKLEQLNGAEPWAYGTWAFYPWSGRLVHVLPCEEFRLVRTDRNRGKIERPDQRRLLGNRIGVIGLSVGNSAAVTFALEGIGGAYKLADFDEFSLSNLNRLRAGVHHLGVNKAVISARQMFEIDPYLDIEIFTDGLTDANMAEFFSGGNGPIDLLVEECDTPYVKIAAREQARTLGIPVVMDCNDRGMLDIERFDLERDRPVLHGLIGDVKASQLQDLTRQEKVDLILAMVDADKISPQLKASFGELGKTLSSWPQLASGVALGGALTAEAARRILLGDACESGRFYTDFAELIAPDRNTAGAA
ncbi:Molybdopterin or thiamine biosynthesis adenylyltransferase [Amycolatopsis xylanica]|uniref:Molybdopterin or thiamine biosynthesis adenylyltransferase n=1 Tax=Amycolatopsis xylanica TaxID=589385 RepID=A0A1H3DH08_9PSEU|nr:ThiF family adenylyltransferase [Amycolatopsis xylanica]SDX65772.1 Molybdopterin or thiamine biosynthesis adenylyltransferase [Amycolatopsis xylanica]